MEMINKSCCIPYILWLAVIDIVGITDIHTGRLLGKRDYEINHYIPWSFITNDEM
jgi:hypothetical protein